jgi:hypothetical protein
MALPNVNFIRVSVVVGGEGQRCAPIVIAIPVEFLIAFFVDNMQTSPDVKYLVRAVPAAGG